MNEDSGGGGETAGFPDDSRGESVGDGLADATPGGGPSGDDSRVAGPSWADIVAGSGSTPSGPERRRVPLHSAGWGGHLSRPMTVVLHTEAFKDVNVKEVMLTTLKCVPQAAIKCLQQVPGPRYRLSFRSLDAKQAFLGKEFILRGEKIAVQELESPALLVKVLHVPVEMSNQCVGEALAKYGRVLSVDREMFRDWPDVESGVRLVKMTALTEGIPRRFSIGSFNVETRYRGQVPQCGRCGSYGHRIATCVNNVKCFKCGQDGHIQRECFKCFLCGSFGHTRVNCPENPVNRGPGRDHGPVEGQAVGGSIDPQSRHLIVGDGGQEQSGAPVDEEQNDNDNDDDNESGDSDDEAAQGDTMDDENGTLRENDIDMSTDEYNKRKADDDPPIQVNTNEHSFVDAGAAGSSGGRIRRKKTRNNGKPYHNHPKC